MSIKEIKYNNKDIDIKFTLSGSGLSMGYQQEIDNIVEETKNTLINPAIDTEVRRFRYRPSAPVVNLFFYFHNGSSWTNTFYGLDTADNAKLNNSFFIVEVFDSTNPLIQKKISTTYVTRITKSPVYQINPSALNQFSDWYIPLSYINSQASTNIEVCVKYSFYNAGNGALAVFYNNDRAGLTTPDKMYFQADLDLSENTWKTPTLAAYAYQYPITNEYSKRVNNTVNNVENKKPNYPQGYIFNPLNGGYDMV